jgi:hypothetical protein
LIGGSEEFTSEHAEMCETASHVVYAYYKCLLENKGGDGFQTRKPFEGQIAEKE